MNPDAAAPVAPRERILTLDIIRGFALLGILVMNIPGFSASFYLGSDGNEPWPAWWDQAALYVRDVLFDGKFNSMFSFLFAIGFTIQLERLHERAPERATLIYTRRLLVLLAFGLVHACLLWPGDVLHVYALLGFLLLVARNWSDGFIKLVIGACLLFPGVMSLYRVATRTPEDVERLVATMQAHEASNNAAYGAGSFLDAAIESTRDMIFAYTGPAATGFTLWFYVMIVATMMLGLLAGRHRWIQDAGQHLPLVRRVQWGALAIGIACGAIYAYGDAVSKPFVPSPWKILFGTCYAVARMSLMVFYVATIVRIAQNPRGRNWLAPFAAAGRMPLTNYLLQSLICLFIFYGWGLGYWGRVGWALQFALGFAIFFLVQVPLSLWWFRRFSYGPMEYLWRVLTYGHRPAAVAAVPAV